MLNRFPYDDRTTRWSHPGPADRRPRADIFEHGERAEQLFPSL